MSEAKGHLHSLDLLLRFMGSEDRLSSRVYRRPWFSRMARVTKAIYSIGFLPRAVGSGGGRFLLRGMASTIERGELWLTDARIMASALRCVASLQPFLIARTDEVRPVQHVCERLGIDLCGELRCYISSNNLLIFFATQQARPVVVHVAGSPAASEDLKRHRAGLQSALAALAGTKAHLLIPAVLQSHSGDEDTVLQQTRLPGVIPTFVGASMDEFYSVLNRAFEPLPDFRATAGVRTEGADRELIFEKFPRVLAEFPELQTMLAPLLVRLQQWQQTRGLSPILTHGDYWPRNILFDQDSGEVTGIVDWEWSRRHGTPGLDALQLVALTALEFHLEFCDYVAQAWTGVWNDPRLADYITRMKTCFGLDDIDIGYLAAMLCFEELEKRKAAGRLEPTGFVGELLKLSEVLEAWLSAQS